MNDSKIGTKEAISLVLIIAITHTILSMPSTLLSNMKSSVLLNLTFVGIIAIAVVALIVKLFKNFPRM